MSIERNLQVIRMDIFKYEVGESLGARAPLRHYEVYAEKDKLGKHWIVRSRWFLGVPEVEDHGVYDVGEEFRLSGILEKIAVDLGNRVAFAKVGVYEE